MAAKLQPGSSLALLCPALLRFPLDKGCASVMQAAARAGVRGHQAQGARVPSGVLLLLMLLLLKRMRKPLQDITT